MNDKNILRIQKILCIIFLIASAAVLLSCFCYFASGWTQFALDGESGNYYLNFYYQLRTSGGLAEVAMPNSNYSVVFESAQAATDYYVDFWFKLQSANNTLFALGISGLVLTAVMFVCGNFGRRKYYIVNLVSGCLAGLVGVIISIVSIVKSSLLIGEFTKIKPDLENFYAWSIKGEKTYTLVDSGNCWIGIIVPIIYMILCGLLIAFVIYKYIRTLRINKDEAVVVNE